MSPNNDKLWLLGGYKALAYAGVIKPYAALTPQTGLFDKTTVVTFSAYAAYCVKIEAC